MQISCKCKKSSKTSLYDRRPFQNFRLLSFLLLHAGLLPPYHLQKKVLVHYVDKLPEHSPFQTGSRGLVGLEKTSAAIVSDACNDHNKYWQEKPLHHEPRLKLEPSKAGSQQNLHDVRTAPDLRCATSRSPTMAPGMPMSGNQYQDAGMIEIPTETWWCTWHGRAQLRNSKQCCDRNEKQADVKPVATQDTHHDKQKHECQ
jgi:hypothetical protein